MKVRKLREFANWLANSRRKFNMSNNCECVAGQAAHFFGGKFGDRTDADEHTLRRAFDLTPKQAADVYVGYSVERHFDPRESTFVNPSRLVAVEVLRFLAKTGKVDWFRAVAAMKNLGKRTHSKGGY